MTYALVAAASLVAVLLALAWAKEFRLRRALQSLLARLFRHWRNAHETNPTNGSHSDDRGPADSGGGSRM
jgi:hypothetical protein